MFYVYVLYSEKDAGLYIGSTGDLQTAPPGAGKVRTRRYFSSVQMNRMLGAM